MMYYIMLAAATVLFSAQFLFNQKFEEECGASMASAALFSLYTSVCGFLILFALNGFVLEASSFSLGLAFIYAFLGTAYSVASIKAFEVVNLSAYSVFSMLGGDAAAFRVWDSILRRADYFSQNSMRAFDCSSLAFQYGTRK